MEFYEPYFLNHKNITRFIESSLPKETKKEVLMNPICKDICKDDLFWYFFIAWKGEAAYEHIKLFNKIEITEKQLKFEFIEKINKKQVKIKKVCDVEENLMGKKINMKTLVALAMIEKVNLLISNEKTFFLCENDFSKPYFRIDQKVEEISLEEMENIKKTRIERRDVDKVLGGISSYKVGELKTIYQKIAGESKMTKQQLYDEITKLIKN